MRTAPTPAKKKAAAVHVAPVPTKKKAVSTGKAAAKKTAAKAPAKKVVKAAPKKVVKAPVKKVVKAAPKKVVKAPVKKVVRATAVKTTSVPTRASRLALVKTAKSINYYPSDAGWSAMWTNFNAAKIEADLTKAKALGADNVRVIVFPTSFGYPKPKADYTANLAKFISIADARGMTVRLTLFDWWSGYGDTAGSVTWAKTVLTPYANDRRVLSVEVQNEFDATNTQAVAWAKKVIPGLRAAVPTMPLTLSVSGTAGITGLSQIRTAFAATPLDYLDFHFYGNSERALTEIRKAQAAAGSLPIVIGETGLSTAGVDSEGDQAAFLARVFAAARAAKVGSVAPWTLYDFSNGAIPSNSAVSKIPAQYKFGLYRADGSAKPAVNVVKAYWAGQALGNNVLDLGFEAGNSNSAWGPYFSKGGSAVRVAGNARTGFGSVQFSATRRNGIDLPSLRIAPITPVQPGGKWHAEAWAKGQNATGSNQIALSWFDANNKWLGQAQSKQLPAGTTGWIRLTVDATAPAGAASVQLHLKSGDNSGTVWFDDVVLS
ncbi:glycosyl hydrolase [Actinoplanes regularis]|uniref:glycosyl hydrolase n=1 Tax=Actinoplanes regularis TaxID=52697 RepID=UPI002557A023|nr:glycosyl hydrolase [Actinoplanes regularis]